MVLPSHGALRGFFGIGVWHPKKEVNTGTLFRSAQSFGASFCFSIGRRFHKQSSDTGKAHKHLPFYEYSDLDDLVKHLPHACPLVAVELAEESRMLDNFCHPERACYLLGAEDHGLSKDVLSKCHSTVTIPGANLCLNVAVAGAIVMYDRVVKRK